MKFFNFFKSKQKERGVKINNSSKLVQPVNNIEFNSTTKLIDVLSFIKENPNFNAIKLNKPAGENDIDFFEKSKKIKLPKDFKTLYKFSNGFETDEFLFRLIPLNEIIDNGKDNYCINDNSFHFTEYMIYSDMWTVEIDTNNNENYKIYHKTNNIVYLTNSLTEFLCVYINKGINDGLYEWRDKI